MQLPKLSVLVQLCFSELAVTASINSLKDVRSPIDDTLISRAASFVDPGVPGPYQASNASDYSLPDVLLPGLSIPVEIVASVVGPLAAAGLRPLVVFLHGNAFTCYAPNPNDPNDTFRGRDITWPCPNGKVSFPSYLGYRQSQDLLATQGYLTISISANSINSQSLSAVASPDFTEVFARSALIRLHLSLWADWAVTNRAQAPAVVQALPPPNMSQILLFGHSRGGEGVNRAAMDSLTRPPIDYANLTTRWQIRGLVLIGPTSFGQNPVPDVPSMTILPGCDGQLPDLQGEMYVDATRGVSRGIALHSAVFVVGANHNNFNSYWTPGDNTGHDPVCGFGSTLLLTKEQQLTIGAVYVAAAARLFTQGDDQVRPLLDGSGASSTATGFATILSHAVGGNRTPFILPQLSTTITGVARLCEEIPSGLNTPCNADHSGTQSPHFAVYESVRPEAGRYAIELTWTSTNQPARFRLPAAKSIAGSESLALRVIVPAGSSGTRIQVFLIDTSNRRSSVGTFTLNGLPDSTPQGSPNWAQEIHLSLSGVTSTGLNLNQLSALEFVPLSGGGKAWLIDAWGWRSGTPDPQTLPLPRIDLGEKTVSKTVAGNVTYHLSIPVTGSASGGGQVRIFIVDPVSKLAEARIVSFASGTTEIDIPIIVGDVVGGTNVTYLIEGKAIQGVFVGDPIGALFVRG